LTRGDPPRKSSSPIRAAEYFLPAHQFKGVKSVRKIETGLECDQRLLRKLKNAVTGAHCAMLLYEHNISQFLNNHRSLSSPVSIFRTDLTPITLCKGRKHSAAQIGDGDSRGGSLLLLLSGSRMSIVFRGLLSNR
jgi:hypothetical protein